MKLTASTMHRFGKALLALSVTTTLLTACQSVPHTKAMTATQVSAHSPSVHKYRLDNGLELIVKEDRRAPVVSTQIWYKVGSSDEPKGMYGISHFLEHMMFKDNKHITGGQYNRLMSEYGALNNAFTSDTYTAYFEDFSSNYYPLALEIEAMRMKDLIIDPKLVAIEKEVIQEERRIRVEDSPTTSAREIFYAFAQPNSGKGQSIIGSSEDINGITAEKLQTWYDTWYKPNNAVLVVVGDVKPDEVYAHTVKYFGNIPAGQAPKRVMPTELTHQGYRQQTTHQKSKTPSLLMGFNVPSLSTAKDADSAYALALYAALLDGSASAYFERVLVREKQLFTRITAHYDAFERGDGLFIVRATPADGVDLATAEAEILALIQKVASEPINEGALKRARTSLVSSITFENDSVSTQAELLGSLAATDLPIDSYDTLATKLQAVDKALINQVAKQYLVKDNLSTLYVLPKK